ncbi:hypothetical protein VPNG_05335 [Cytospora leucostoma]|uniref:Uncharacterized protein n=1 Tax=Cytospora leucostoma TaxID=1230097 RepID=A0A423X557_9PEZI|nr:hypothetical protein VPNG_05335 [Cytospora leucostoma]
MSLTSLSGGYGYGYAPSRTPRLPPTPKKPIFYDYSEVFEDVTEPPPVCPIAPIPKRVSNPYRPVNNHSDFDTRPEGMDEAQHEFVAYLQEATLSELHGGSGNHEDEEEEPQSHFCQENNIVQDAARLSAVEHESNLDPTSRGAVHVVDFGASTPRTDSREKEADAENCFGALGLTREVATTEVASDSSTPSDPPEPDTPAFTTAVPSRDLVRCSEDSRFDINGQDHLSAHVVDAFDKRTEERLCSSTTAQSDPLNSRRPDAIATLPYVASNRCRDSRLYSLGSGLSDLASFVNQVDRHFQTPGLKDPDGPSAEVRHDDAQCEARALSTIGPLDIGDGQRKTHEHHLLQGAKESSHPPRTSSLRHYRRQQAELEPNTRTDEAQQYQVVATRSGPTMVPQPISPAKLLRVKNSIPQLMKALPPLPAPAPESPFGPTVVPMEFEPFELSRLTDARSTLSDEIVHKSRGKEAPQGYDPYVFDRKACKPKLKLRHAASFAHERSRDLRHGYTNHGRGYSDKRPATATEYSTAPVKRRLPIKVSRPTLRSLPSEDTGTVKRRPCFQKSSTFSEFVSSQPVDLFSSSAETTENREAPPTEQINTEIGGVPTLEFTRVAKIQKTFVDYSGARASSLDAHMNSLRVPTANNEAFAEAT